MIANILNIVVTLLRGIRMKFKKLLISAVLLSSTVAVMSVAPSDVHADSVQST